MPGSMQDLCRSKGRGGEGKGLKHVKLGPKQNPICLVWGVTLPTAWFIPLSGICITDLKRYNTFSCSLSVFGIISSTGTIP